jgi:hypothetical protein
MPITQNDLNLANVILGALPKILELIRGLHASSHPSDPAPTDAQVVAALLQAGVQSIAVDEQWKASHPA